ncbi:MAG: autotransporter-associated beta strand repeat-containing protein, partial [Opitutales bacterium]|nr:autotransporter-associated beta strand repeat-containing protein [Opitutales bacterium]
TVNGGTIAVDSSAVVFNDLDLASTTFAAETAGLQEGVQETYTLYSGTGTISGLTATNVTVNGGAVTSVTGNTAVRELSIYNILAGSEANYTDEGVSTADRINVLGTLDCGVITGATGGNIVGTGTVKMESQLVGHGASLAFSNDFTGTVEFTGKLNTGSTSLSKDATLKLYNYSTTTSSLWGGGTLACDVLFQTNYQIGDSTGTTIGFSGNVTGATGTTVTITGNAVANFNGTSTFDTLNTYGTTSFGGTTSVSTLNASGTIGLSGATSVTTMNIATGTTLNLNGVHNLTAESVVLNEGATLTLGDLSDGQNVNLSGLTGSGTISVSKTFGNHGHTVNLGTQFTGTIELKGYFNSTNLTLGSSEGTVKLNGVWFWGGHPAFDRAVEFVNTEDVIVGSGNTGKNYSSNGMTFNKGATFKEGAKFSINGNSENWGAFTLEKNAQASISGDFVVSAWSSTNGAAKTLTLKEGATLNVSGTLADNSGLNLTNDGTINVGNLRLASGLNDTISGTGTINAAGVLVDNNGTYNVTVKRLNIGSSGITAQTNVWGYKLVFGDMTVGASADWKAESSDGLNGHVCLGATENGGTKFDTNGFSISIGTTLSDQSSNAVGALTKVGAGTLTLSNANSYSGGTTISAGTLVAANASALGTGPVSVATDAKLGLVAGTTVTGVTGGIALSDGAKLVIDLSSKVGETETFTLDLITGTTITFGETSLASNSSNVADTWYELSGWDKDGWTSTLNYDSASQTLSLTMTIPEPSAFGLLAGVSALALVVARRKRRK